MSIIDGYELDELRDKAAQCEAFRAKLSESLGREMVLRAALKPFADYADKRHVIPAWIAITSGAALAKNQLIMGDCYNAAAALEQKAGEL